MSKRSDSVAKLGQVWTPKEIAAEMANMVSSFCNAESEILDPAAGPLTFYKACREEGLLFRRFTSYEIDPAVILEATTKDGEDKNHEIILGDFLDGADSDKKYNVAILNPPYVRHEQLDLGYKNLWHSKLGQLGYKGLNRRMNLYGFFLLLTAAKLERNGVICAIVYDSMSFTEYGKQVNSYLASTGIYLSRKSISAPFSGVMVDAEILLWQKKNAGESLAVGETSSSPLSEGHCKISELVDIRRGTGFPNRKEFTSPDPQTGKYMKLVTKQPPEAGLLVQPNSWVRIDVLSGDPVEDELTLGEGVFEKTAQGIDTKKLKTGPILFNYYFRNNPRHLFNPLLISASDNFYCLTPKNSDWTAILWMLCNSNPFIVELNRLARTQGSGLRKLQAFEYREAEMVDLRLLDRRQISTLKSAASALVSGHFDFMTVNKTANLAMKTIGFGGITDESVTFL